MELHYDAQHTCTCIAATNKKRVFEEKKGHIVKSR